MCKDKSPAGAPEIEITLEMIDAGVAELERQYLGITDGPPPGSFQEAVSEIYRAMERIRTKAAL